MIPDCVSEGRNLTDYLLGGKYKHVLVMMMRPSRSAMDAKHSPANSSIQVDEEGLVYWCKGVIWDTVFAIFNALSW